MRHVVLATGLARRGDSVLLVASHYANHAQPIWGLPGGRRQGTELLREAVVREVREETGLHASVRELLYVSESYDRAGATHVTNVTFSIGVSGELRTPGSDDHVVEVRWVPLGDIARLIAVAVVREPLLACINGTLPQRYAGYPDAGITIRWPDEPSEFAR